jgi:uncharacterized protein (DUF433 family)
MNWKKRIIVDAQILNGKPVIKGTRLAVEFIVDLLANGWTNNEILRNYPNLTQEDIRAAWHMPDKCCMKKEYITLYL